MLTLANIIEWEQLTGKKLQEYDSSSIDDMAALGYVQYEDRRKWTLAEYKDALLLAKETKELESVARRAALEFRYIAQFNARRVEADDEKNDDSITDICGQLITNGIDGNFLLSRGLEDLGWLTRAACQPLLGLSATIAVLRQEQSTQRQRISTVCVGSTTGKRNHHRHGKENSSSIIQD